MTLNRALLLLLALAMLSGLLPAAVVLDRRLGGELELRAHEDLGRAAHLLADREAAIADAMMMHAKEVAQAGGLAAAVVRGNWDVAAELIEAARGGFAHTGVLYERDGTVRLGEVGIGEALLAETAAGEMPVEVVAQDTALYRVGLAPIETAGGEWLGTAGVAERLDDAFAAVLAALSHAEVVLFTRDGRTAAAMAEPGNLAATRAAAGALDRDGEVRELRDGGRRLLLARAPLGADGEVVFIRDLELELAILPKLRLLAGTAAAAALGLGLLAALLLATMLTRPVRVLAAAADRVAAGDFASPLPSSSIAEVRRLADAFAEMRRALAARLAELEAANRELAERQERLRTLQVELIQRERLAANERLVAGLAHEIRNPIASVRNCLEVVHRRLRGDAEGAEFTAMAIDELLRMHELAEQLLDLHRPRDAAIGTCAVGVVAREVALLTGAGVADDELHVEIDGDAYAAIPPDALKQVLVNLVQNARDARPSGLRVQITARREAGTVVIDVRDNGPGVPAALRDTLFEPFVTSKRSVGGAGLGLFVAEGVVRRYGGRIRLLPPDTRGGAHFEITLVDASIATVPAPSRADPVEAER